MHGTTLQSATQMPRQPVPLDPFLSALSVIPPSPGRRLTVPRGSALAGMGPKWSLGTVTMMRPLGSKEDGDTG